MARITIEVVFDFVCAWCFVGKRQLERALELYRKTYPGGKQDNIVVTWRPYFLNYNLVGNSVDKSELAKTKLSDMDSKTQAALTRRMEQIGRGVGINFNWGGRIGNTRNAHRLVYASREKGQEVEDALVEALFRAYHELEQDISDSGVLRTIAVEAGLDEQQADEMLGLSSLGEEVNAEAEAQKQRVGGVGVPCFFVQRDEKVGGAMDALELMDAIVRAKQQAKDDDPS
ncbi:hypothetical protein HIM_05147 [Hirsutella minnesotensis 3608]|uniref:DSBA-like thioredoxin domain-containing protein n=1 Tax=Hirsutella minnesotensis 3608 TaxID=1043627 RepID=A0A0F7ZKN8_9HYPO|nr:hypothetical protein HIM_05147 [Hirsutella minnesotensis 3608]